MLLRKKTQGAAAVPSSKIRDSLNLDEEWVITEAGIHCTSCDDIVTRLPLIGSPNILGM